MVFEKLYKFIGRDIKSLIERPDGLYCFRLQKSRVYYVSEALMKRATNVARDKLVALGVVVGKLTHSGKFRLTIGALDLLAQHAKHKVFVGVFVWVCCCVCAPRLRAERGDCFHGQLGASAAAKKTRNQLSSDDENQYTSPRRLLALGEQSKQALFSSFHRGAFFCVFFCRCRCVCC